MGTEPPDKGGTSKDATDDLDMTKMVLDDSKGVAVLDKKFMDMAKRVAADNKGQTAHLTDVIRTVVKEQMKDYAREGKILAVRESFCNELVKDVFGERYIEIPDNKEDRKAAIAKLRKEYASNYGEEPDMEMPGVIEELYVAETAQQILQGLNRLGRQMESNRMYEEKGYERGAGEALKIRERHAAQIEELSSYIVQLKGNLENFDHHGRLLAEQLNEALAEADSLRHYKETMEAKDMEMAKELSQRRELSPVPIAEPSWVGVASGRDKRSRSENVAMDLDEPGTSAQHARAAAQPASESFNGKPERIAISDPVKFDGDPRKGVDIRLWLRNLERYFKDKNQDPAKYGRYGTHYLSGQAQRLWDCELNDLHDKGEFPTWDRFSAVMISYYGSIIPAREHRAEYGKCTQKGSVMDFVTELKVIVQTLKGTDFAPSKMDVIEQFLRGLKADVRKYVEDNAPEGWYSEPKDVYDKAIQYETNQNSRTPRVQVNPRVNVMDRGRGRNTWNNGRGRAGSQNYDGNNQGNGRGRGRGRGSAGRQGQGQGQGGRIQWPNRWNQGQHDKQFGPAVPPMVKDYRIKHHECITCGGDHPYRNCPEKVFIPPTWYKDPNEGPDQGPPPKPFSQSRNR